MPHDTTVIWRYFDFAKFVSLIDRHELWFPSAAALEDPLEASLPWPKAGARHGSSTSSGACGRVTTSKWSFAAPCWRARPGLRRPVARVSLVPMASIFTRIIRGELPCWKVLENDHVIAFLARDAIQPGHTLVVPKVEVDHWLDVPEPHFSAVFEVSRRVGKAIQAATGCRRVGTITAGWDVPHFHHHIVPMWDPGDLSFSKARVRTDDENRAILEKIRAGL
jgi:histidine triad (HIT) family protein